jgi:membrane associated rhomboid family serine protease
MFPIDDDNPTRTTVYVTYSLIAVNTLIFLYQLTLNETALTQFFYNWAIVPLGIFPLIFSIPAFYYLGIWFLQQALYSFATLGPKTNVGMSGGGIAYWAHAGGFVCGAILGPLLGLFSENSTGNY